MSRGYFITFEGLDGSGKTTQLHRLAASLTTLGHRVTTLRQPGGTALGDRLRSVLLDSRSEAALGPIDPLAELALMFADRAQAVAEVIEPALAAGEIVLCDRFTDSSEAYQGAGRQLGSAPFLLFTEPCVGISSLISRCSCFRLWPPRSAVPAVATSGISNSKAPTRIASSASPTPSTVASTTPTGRSPPVTAVAS